MIELLKLQDKYIFIVKKFITFKIIIIINHLYYFSSI